MIISPQLIESACRVYVRELQKNVKLGGGRSDDPIDYDSDEWIAFEDRKWKDQEPIMAAVLELVAAVLEAEKKDK